MPGVTTITTPLKGVTDLARDAAYVAVGLGVLGFQRAQVQRIELKNKLATDFSLDGRFDGVRTNISDGVSNVRDSVSKGVKQIDGLAETAANFVETTLQPLEERLPAQVTQLTSKAREQAREVRTQIRQRVGA
jgi:hypothetical protein